MVIDILPDILYDISQAGFLPPLDEEAAGIITDSEAIFKEFATKRSLNASTINSFIKDVLKIRLSMRMKLMPTCCSDCKPPSTVVTFRSFTCTLRGLELLRCPVEKVLRKLTNHCEIIVIHLIFSVYYNHCTAYVSLHYHCCSLDIHCIIIVQQLRKSL
jgi:hypothetical protein